MIDAVTHKAAGLLRANPEAALSAGKKEPVTTASSEAKSSEPSATPLSPRLRYDAVSGVVITEFLDQSGAVSAQTPNNAVLAYLRVGLDSDGSSKKDDKESAA